MTDPTTAALDALEAELQLRLAVERRHATFHVKPSPASADALQRALNDWRGDPGLTPLIMAITAELQRQADASFGGYIDVDSGPTAVVLDGVFDVHALAAAVAKITGQLSTDGGGE